MQTLSREIRGPPDRVGRSYRFQWPADFDSSTHGGAKIVCRQVPHVHVRCPRILAEHAHGVQPRDMSPVSS